MDFKDILERYENDIAYANRMLKPDSLSFFKKTKEYWIGYKKASFKWFQDMKVELGYIPLEVDILEEEINKYVYIDELNNYYTPYRMLEYRGEKIPMYIDDYGQQIFIVYNNKAYYGGAYNINTNIDFCTFIDTIKDEID